jgi:sterol desaturase/sphingolipid hydroxylase (fatty acid hydroxylase superfamily)
MSSPSHIWQRYLAWVVLLQTWVFNEVWCVGMKLWMMDVLSFRAGKGSFLSPRKWCARVESCRRWLRSASPRILVSINVLAIVLIFSYTYAWAAIANQRLGSRPSAVVIIILYSHEYRRDYANR